MELSGIMGAEQLCKIPLVEESFKARFEDAEGCNLA